MPRSRNLKPVFFLDEDLADFGPLHQILYWGLPCLADAAGRLEDKPRTIKASIFPFYDADVHTMLDDLATVPYLSRYIVSGSRVIQIHEHEKLYTPHKNEPESSLPALSDAESGSIASVRDNSGSNQDSSVLARQSARSRSRSRSSQDLGTTTAVVARGPNNLVPLLADLARCWPKTRCRDAHRVSREAAIFDRHQSFDIPENIVELAQRYIAAHGFSDESIAGCPSLHTWIADARWLEPLPQPKKSAAQSRADETDRRVAEKLARAQAGGAIL